MDIFLLWMSCVVRNRSLRRADHSSREVLPTMCVVVCSLETSTIGAPYIYIYDISSNLRVNDLTLILLTWRKSWTPNNASKWQVWFNSAFKVLKYFYIILPTTTVSSKLSLSLWFFNQNPVSISLLHHTSHIPCTSHSSWFHHPNHWSLQTKKPQIIQFPQDSTQGSTTLSLSSNSSSHSSSISTSSISSGSSDFEYLARFWGSIF